MKHIGPTIGFCIALVAGALAPRQACAHEFWIEPFSSHIAPGDMLQAHLKVGTRMKGDTYAYLPNQILSFLLVRGKEARRVQSSVGDLPAVHERVSEAGLVRLAYVSLPSKLIYDTREKFEIFAKEEGQEALLARHRERGLPESGFAELFSRCAKALIAVGDGAGEDRAIGLPFELIVETNPYTSPPSAPMSVRLLWQGAAAPDVQVLVLRKGPDGNISVERPRTDDEGRVTFASAPGFFLLSAVKEVEPSPVLTLQTGAVWQSIWASTTFTRAPPSPPRGQ